jgi:hypothetical protein
MRYIERSDGKSRRALEAEQAMRYPASKIASLLKACPAAFIIAHAPHGGEWHHTGLLGNATNYYDLQAVETWFCLPETKQLLREFKAAVKAEKVGLRAGQADISVEQGETYFSNYGKRLFRKVTHKFKNVAVTPVGTQFVCIAGHGRVSRSKIRHLKWLTPETL